MNHFHGILDMHGPLVTARNVIDIWGGSELSFSCKFNHVYKYIRYPDHNLEPHILHLDYYRRVFMHICCIVSYPAL